MYPLRFKPIFKPYVWGGRRLATVLGKELPGGQAAAESWEICDRDADQSVVAVGPLAGKTLRELITQHAAELLGRHALVPRFPLLFKFLDAREPLSVQVHPNDEQAARLDPPDLGKTEAWVILDALPGSVIYAGLKRGFDRPALQREANRGTTHLCLNKFEPQVGDCIFIPAGTVHALGAGLLIAEVQQASDTTYRLFDWNRVGVDGQPRPLHVDQALEVIDYARGPVNPTTPQATSHAHAERLVTCDKFILDRWRFDTSLIVGGDERFHFLAVLTGEVEIEGDPCDTALRRGDTVLIPAALGPVQIKPSKATTLLDAYLP
jgi:mannose-6-phosphate isomerase